MDSQLKNKRLRELSNEVKDFHPLLLALLKRLPSINRVEYSHGQNEMGADFILHKKDMTLGDIDYVGVIAKVDDIKQDHADVERQIRECGVERLTENGKKKVFLTEIWITTSGNISQNAKLKINHEHKNTKIKFIDGQHLITLIDTHYADYWTDVSVHIGEYFRSVRAKAFSMQLALTGMSGKSIIVERELEPVRVEKKFNSRPKKIQRKRIAALLAENRFILIEAPMGGGKSTLLSQIANQFADNESYNTTKCLPIVVSAKELYELHDCDIKLLIEKTLEANSLAAPDSLIVIVDAIDELKLDGDLRSRAFKNIYDSCSASLKIKVVMSCRPIDDPFLSAQLEKYFTCYKICPLSINQIIRLVDDICENAAITKRLSKDIEKSHVFRALPRTPISALLLARLLKENVQEIPSTMTELYSKFMELVLGRWDMTKGLQSQMEYDVLSNVVSDIGKFSIENSIPNIPVGDIKSLIQNYIDTRNLKIDKAAAFKLMLSKSDLFIHNPYTDTISFGHRTFAEYFYATHMARSGNAVLSAQMFDNYWANSYFFYIGIKRDCPDLIETIESLTLLDDRLRLMKMLVKGNFLLAAYLTPYEVIAKAVKNSFIEAAQLIQDVESGKFTPLTKLSKMQLLCIITHMMADSYGYEYFCPALQERALDLYSSPSLDNRDLTEIFLVNATLMLVTKADTFDTMLDSYGKDIPLELKMAIFEHSGEHGVESKAVKKFTSNFFKKAKNNSGLIKSITAIYDQPIDLTLGIKSN